MNIYPVQMNNLSANLPNFKANFIHNEISKDILRVSSQSDIAEFTNACEALKKAKNDQRNFFLSGVTSNYGVCCETEVDDKFIELNAQKTSLDIPEFLYTWFIRGEKVVSGGCKKQDLLKEITKALKSIANENAFHSLFGSETVVVKKAKALTKVI